MFDFIDVGSRVDPQSAHIRRNAEEDATPGPIR